MSSGLELVGAAGGPFAAVIFDFDGTLSLLRRNWQDVMIPMMVKVLQETKTDETEAELYSLVEEFVMRLNGKQTIYQMIELASQVAQRGQSPCEPLQYKAEYHRRLSVEVDQRVAAIRQTPASRDDYLVPGARQLLDRIFASELSMYLASGTDLVYVRQEVELLGLAKYFGDEVYGALDDYQQFSKAQVIQQIIARHNIDGKAIVGFGDGFVEIEEVKRVGGTAVGVASNETSREGINQRKRQRLLDAGADLIVGDYRGCDELLRCLKIG